jgi:hypothetical protein
MLTLIVTLSLRTPQRYLSAPPTADTIGTSPPLRQLPAAVSKGADSGSSQGTTSTPRVVTADLLAVLLGSAPGRVVGVTTAFETTCSQQQPGQQDVSTRVAQPVGC